jgi:acetolactate synthase-1/2/3 large subunit
MKVSDYVVRFLLEHDADQVFLVAGGGIMHLLDSIGNDQRMRYYCARHEQACAVNAEGYARMTNRPGVCLVTTGPGAVNALSGILGAWTDSLPMLVISGQVRRDLMADFRRLRQMGPQEANIVEMARPVTKYSATVVDPTMIRRELECAWHHALAGRPGPAWIEIPVDVQGLLVDVGDLAGFVPHSASSASWEVGPRSVGAVVEALRRARRPLLVCGNGIHLAGSEGLLAELLDMAPVPMVLPDSAKDLVAEDHPRNMGIFGTAGQRRANFAIQNSDCLLAVGVGLCSKKTGFNVSGLAPNAIKLVVDIDRDQLDHQVIKPDLAIQADAGVFLRLLIEQLSESPLEPQVRWLDACSGWRRRYPLILDEYFTDRNHVNSYVFMDRLSDSLGSDDVLVAGNGLDTVSYIQAFRTKRNQRTMTSGNWGAMGWDLPLAVGACIGSGRRRTICVTGDGSIQLNIQELMTISHYALPIKVFVFNNAGFGSIRATQRNLFAGRLVASAPDEGVDDPDFEKTAAAFGLPFDHIDDNDGVADGIHRVLALDGPTLCEVKISPDQEITPKASAFRRQDGTLESRPLEDMSPFLAREEVWENMHLFDDETEEPAR